MTAVPTFAGSQPAPPEWQERVRSVHPDLCVVWNPHHLDGPRWAIIRRTGPNRLSGGVLIDRTEPNNLVDACSRGWAFVKNCETPDGAACGVNDHIIGWLRRAELKRRYGERDEGAIDKLIAEGKGLEEFRQGQHDKAMKDAFDDMNADHALTHGAITRPVKMGDRA